MICYRDMTFCKAQDCAKFEGCSRALTDKVWDDARRWWGKDGAPVAWTERMECFEPKEDS